NLEKLRNERADELLHLEEHVRQQVTLTARLAQAGHAQHLLDWLESGTIGRGDAIELAEPWIIEGWRKARANVFIQALALHRCFFELEAKRVRSNLYFINSML